MPLLSPRPKSSLGSGPADPDSHCEARPGLISSALVKTPSLHSAILCLALSFLPGILQAGAALNVVGIEATVPVTTEPGPTIRVFPGKFTLTRKGDTSEALTVSVLYRGSALPGIDYQRLPERVDFAAHQESVTLLVVGIDDDEIESDEEIGAQLVDPTREGTYQVHPEHHSAVVTLKDSDQLLEHTVVSIKATQPIAEETASPLRRFNLVGELTVSRTGPTTDPLAVWIHLAGSATPRSDYDPLPLSVTIPSREHSVTIPVRALFDQEPEGIESVIATLSNCPPETDPPLGAPCRFFNLDPASASATVYIREDGLSRASVNLSKPGNNQHFRPGEPVALKAVAVDMAGYISRVEFFAGNVSIGVSEIFFFVAPDPGRPITHHAEWLTAPRGVHELTARAEITDSRSGATRITSVPVRISVGDQPTNHPPEMGITSPQSSDQFPAGEAIEIVAEGADPDGFISRVEFFANGMKIGEQQINFLIRPPDGQPQRFAFLWEHPMPGRYDLTVLATDDEGGSQRSRPVDITVLPRDSRPVVNVVARDAHAVEPGEDQRTNPALFHIRRHGSTLGPLTVSYTIGGDAENGVDYDRVSGTAVIPDGESGVNVTIVPLADEEREGPESVKLSLNEGPYSLEFPRRAYAVIYDYRAENPDRPRCVRLPDDLLHFCFPARAGVCFRIESTSNLRDWETLFCLISLDGTVHLVDERTPGLRRRFFRATEEPNGLPE